VKATNEELREALEACVTVIDEYKPALYGEAWHGLFRAAHNARALLNRKSCAECKWGEQGIDEYLCSWKVLNGPNQFRALRQVAFTKDYANDCEEYQEKPE